MSPGIPNDRQEAHLQLHEARFATSGGMIRCAGWEVLPGEAWFVSGGPSAGKTSLLRLLAGLERVRAGRVERFGDDWDELSETDVLANRRRIGVVLCREAGLFHRHTVVDNIRLPLLYHGEIGIDERVSALLTAFHLETVAGVPSIHLTPAQARRTLLARALALEPEILLLDDPCSDLEEWERRRLLQLLQGFRCGWSTREGRPMTLIVTGTAPEPWRSVNGMRWALLRSGELGPVDSWEQLVASAPELFHDPLAEGPD